MTTPTASRPALAPGMRNNIDTMLLPFFPEDGASGLFSATVDGYLISMHSDVPGGRIATASDRKILNVIAARVGALIRSGQRPTRHIIVNVRDMIEAIACDGVIGGTEYQRVAQRLERLAATWITTEVPIGDQISRKRQFRWIDAFEQDVQSSSGGQRILRLKISLSEDAFHWMTRNDGFDLTREQFHALTASRSSSWRIYEICLAQLIRNHGREVLISIEELRQRIPITAELKVFKARTLKASMKAISDNQDMARAIRLELKRQTDEGGFEPLPEGKRAPLDRVYVSVRGGTDPLPKVDRLLPPDAFGAALGDGGYLDPDMLAADIIDGDGIILADSETEQLPLFRRREGRA